MIKYIFILGHNQALSVLEIIKTIQKFSGKFNLLCCTSQVLIVETYKTIAIDNYLDKLGGTIKIGILEGPSLNLSKDSDDLSEIQDYIITELGKLSQQEKIKYGFSIYTGGQEKFWQKKFNQLGLKVKGQLKLHGKKSRYLVSRESSLSSVIIQKEKLVNKGRDFIFFIQGNKLFLGRTLTVQNFSNYSERDYGRPGRDLFSGMLPVKLAKILINISSAQQDEAILDPFCGSGTILTEALIMGFKKISGTDNSQLAIANTKNNINWLLKKFNIKKNECQIFLDKKAVGDLPRVFAAKSFQAIITEPYLGNPLKSRAGFDLRSAEIKEIKNLYFHAFDNFFHCLKPGGSVVIIWPVYSVADVRGNHNFSDKAGLLFLDEQLLEKISTLGFSQERFDDTLAFVDNAEKFITKRGSILYFRPGQRVHREIFIFKKK